MLLTLLHSERPKGKRCAFNSIALSAFNPIALRKAKIVCNFGLSECNRVNVAFVFLFRQQILKKLSRKRL